MATSKVYSVSEKEFQQIIENSTNFRQCILALGYKPNGRHAYDLIRKRCEELNISYSHFCVEGNATNFSSNKSLDEILVENSTYQNISALKEKILKAKLLEYKCAFCGNTGEWQGKPLTLQLDHINGEHLDHRITNLRFLCPNCHTQTETFGSRQRRAKSNNGQ